MKLNRKNKKGFTIVELVIVIAVIGVLSAILIPTFANLTTNAQKASRKQQASDAYTAYLVEATDNKYDELYTRTGTAEPYTYTPASVKIEHKAQKDVYLKLDNKYYFTYDSKDGWVESETVPTGTYELVCKPYTVAPVAATYFYQKTGDASYNQLVKQSGETPLTAEDGNKQMSTFNGVIVYYKAA